MKALILISLLFAPAQGDAPLIGSLSFEGNRSMSASQLMRFINAAAEGRRYAPENLEAELRQVEAAYQDAGFLQVRLEKPDVRLLNEREVAVRIRIHEGPRYAAGAITVKKAGPLAPESVARMAPLRTGDPYSRIKMRRWRVQTEDAYRSLGFLRARCEIAESLNEAARTVDSVLACAEGKVYTIGKITFTGDPSLDLSQVRRRLLFSEGGTFDPEMLSLTVQYLNQMRLYQPLSGSDIGIQINDETGTVNLSLRIMPLPAK